VLRYLLADGSSGGVLHSNDGGTQWEKLDSPGHSSPIACLVQDPQQLSTIYLGTKDDGMYCLRLRKRLSQADAP
jgi:hypothetical protein